MRSSWMISLWLAAAPAWAAEPEEPREQIERDMQQAREDMRRAREELRTAMKQVQRDPHGRHGSWSWGHSGHLGIMIRDLSGVAGVPVDGVTPGGPAEKAGLRAGDVLLSANGRSLVTPGDGGEHGFGMSRLMETVQEAKAGEAVTIEYKRGKDTTKVKIVPERGGAGGGSGSGFGFGYETPEVPETPEAPELPGIHIFHSLSEQWRDMDLAAVNPELGEYFGTQQGVLVLKVPSGSGLPLKAGDVISKIGDRQPATPSQAVRILRSYEPGETVKIDIVRKKDKQTVSFKMPDR
jgi:S1-C subfamily serine protease